MDEVDSGETLVSVYCALVRRGRSGLRGVRNRLTYNRARNSSSDRHRPKPYRPQHRCPKISLVGELSVWARVATIGNTGTVIFAPRTTARLLLRPIGADDAAELAERRSDPTTAEYQGWSVPYSVEKAQTLVAECVTLGGPTPGSWYQIIVVERATQRTIGDVAVHLSDNAKTAEIGYTLNPGARGLGYATEAASALCHYLITDGGVHRLQASTHPDNAASIRVLTRLGFQPEGIRRESYWVDDVVTDDALFGLLAREFQPG